MFQEKNTQLTIKKIVITTLSITISVLSILAGVFGGYIFARKLDLDTVKKEEEYKLKSEISQRKIDKVVELLELIQEPILTFRTPDSDLAKSIEGYSGSYHNCCTILKDADTFQEWTTKFHEFTSQNRFLFTNEINLYITQIYIYDGDLAEILARIPEDYIWQVGVVLHSEIAEMYTDLSRLLQKYLNSDIYDLDKSIQNSYSRVVKLSDDLDLIKYKDQILQKLATTEQTTK